MNLRALPKLRDSISYIYLEHSVLEQDNSSLIAIQGHDRIAIPVSAVTCIMLGPGTSVTHAAVKIAAENGCMLVWCGENVQRFYASGTGETRSSDNLLRQAKLCMYPESHLEVARRMYIRRFGKAIIGNKDYSIQQLRGMEGLRVRETYKVLSKSTGVNWENRDYKTNEWDEQDPINKALSTANAILYSICHAAIVSLGFSPALGFVHTGKGLSFVYDIADLYKADTTIPAAFYAVREFGANAETAVRANCRRMFEKIELLKRIPEDIEWIFDSSECEQLKSKATGNLWGEDGTLPGGKNYGGKEKWL